VPRLVVLTGLRLPVNWHGGVVIVHPYRVISGTPSSFAPSLLGRGSRGRRASRACRASRGDRRRIPRGPGQL